jgi:WD40 repeat protein/serine/threonine protein kinase
MTERSVFLAVLDIENPTERAAYLDRACAGDPALRAQVEQLLKAHQEPGPFMDRPAPVLVDTAEEPISERPGTIIGPYKLMEQIGEGGMGLVFVAEQQQPVRRKVALKVIKPGMDTREVIARFEAERQALALMDHPHIAHVLDAGATASGRPYFVMELVKGVPITQFCDDHRLQLRQRLELFLNVCQAVQHAHQKGIIHRDLKPANVLVSSHDGTPVVKVIDFGVAKAVGQQLTEKTVYTGFAQMIGTPLYMSPEQAGQSGLDVDTRSDLYALGVLLYELLTGTTPFEGARLRQAGYDEIRRIIREEEPPKPSTRISTLGQAASTVSDNRQSDPKQLGQLMRGELDWIVMKALEKDRNRRYETASAFAADVQRYLQDEPVLACPPSAGYRLRKFARKNKKLLATAAGFAALLIAGATVSTWQAVRATQAEAEAQANEKQAHDNAVQAQKNEQHANQQRDEARALAEQLRRTTYTARINLAQHAWEASGPDRVRDLLEQHRPKPGGSDLRNFEWYFLYRLCNSDLLTLKYSGEGHGVAYSPDGKLLASASGQQVKVWDAQTGKELRTIKGYAASVTFSPDGKRLASASEDNTVKVWDAQTGQDLLTIQGQAGLIEGVVFSPDGKRLATFSSIAIRKGKPFASEIKVLDAQTSQELLTLKPEEVLNRALPPRSFRGLAFSPDGKRLASSDDDSRRGTPGVVKVWDAETGKEQLSLQGHTGKVASVAFSPDGKRLASSSRQENTIKVWDAQTGQDLLTLKGHTGGVPCMVFSPDGNRLASASEDSTVKVWDAQTGQELLTHRGHSSTIYRVAFSPDGQRLASISWDNTVKIWDAQAGLKPLALKDGATSINNVAFSPDGKRLASASADRTVKVWDAQTGQKLFTLEEYTGHPAAVAFSPDGKLLATGSTGGGIGSAGKVWDAQTRKELFILKGHTYAIVSLAFSPDGKCLASGAEKYGPLSRWPGVDSPAGEVKIWDTQTGKEVLTINGFSRCLAYSQDGKRLASASIDISRDPAEGSVRVWDTQTGQELITLKGYTALVNSVAFSPDGKHLASAAEDKMVKVWDAQTGEELLTLKGHTDWVNSVAFSPDGKRLASAARNKTVKIWDAQTGEELLTFKENSGFVSGVAFSPDGQRLTISLADGTVKIWDATPLPAKP